MLFAFKLPTFISESYCISSRGQERIVGLVLRKILVLAPLTCSKSDDEG